MLVAVLAWTTAAQATSRISVGVGGVQADEHCHSPTISGDGHWVAFVSKAPNLVEGDTNALGDVFVRDRTYTPFEEVCAPGADRRRHLAAVAAAGAGRAGEPWDSPPASTILR